MNHPSISRRIHRQYGSQHGWITAVDATRVSGLQNRVASTVVISPIQQTPAILMACGTPHWTDRTR